MPNAKDVLEWMERQEQIKREQTNDEWRKTCSIEEFAEWLKKVSYICFACSDMCAEISDEYCKYGYASEKDKWVEWLKQPHRDKE